MSNIENNQPKNQNLKESSLRREKIVEESRLRCSQVYSELFNLVSANSKLPTREEFDTLIKELKPKEKKRFETVLDELSKRQIKIKEVCEQDPNEVFEKSFNSKPIEKVELIFDPRFPILKIGALDSWNLPNFAGIACIHGLICIMNRDIVENSNSTLEQKAGYALSTFKAIVFADNGFSEEREKRLIDVIKGAYEKHPEDEITEFYTNRDFRTAKQIRKGDESIDQTLFHEFRHILQGIFGQEILDKQGLIFSVLQKRLNTKGNKNTFFEKIYTENSFFTQNRQNLNENEINCLNQNLEDWFENQDTQKYVFYKVAKEFSAFLSSEYKDLDISKIKERLPNHLLKAGYLLNNFVRPINEFMLRALFQWKVDENDKAEFETQGKIEIIKIKFEETAKKKSENYCLKVIKLSFTNY